MDVISNDQKDTVCNETNMEQKNRDYKQKSGKLVLKKHKDYHYRSKVLHSVWLAVSLFSLGLTVGQMGPTFLDLQIITDTDLEKASVFFTGSSIGYLTGSFIAGAIYTKVNKPLLQFLALVTLGVSSLAVPYCSLYPLMICIRSLVGICCGCIDTTGNAEQMRIWGNEGQALMQLLHFSFAFGGVISPLYSEPFLAEKVEEQNITGQINSFLNVSQFSNNLTNVTDSGMTLQQTTNVHWAFLITAVITFISAIPFLVLFIQGIRESKKTGTTKTNKVLQRKLPIPVLLATIFLLCSFYMLYCCVEDTFASFLMTFLVNEFKFVTKSKGAHVTAMYWASFAGARFSMILISKFLSALRLLCLCCFFMLVAYTSFFVSASYTMSNPSALYAVIFFSCMAGISMSAVFPAGFSWTEAELLRVTGPVSSCILISASLGTMINPLLLGYLMEELSNMWFCYLLLGETVLLCCVFIFLLAFNRCFINRFYGTLLSDRATSLTLEVPEQNQPLNVNGH